MDLKKGGKSSNILPETWLFFDELSTAWTFISRPNKVPPPGHVWQATRHSTWHGSGIQRHGLGGQTRSLDGSVVGSELACCGVTIFIFNAERRAQKTHKILRAQLSRRENRGKTRGNPGKNRGMGQGQTDSLVGLRLPRQKFSFRVGHKMPDRA